MPGMKYKLKNNQSATLDKKLNCDITIRLPGFFSVYNSLAAVAVWDDIMSDKKMELSNDRYRVMANVLESFSVQGRTELMESVFGYRVMVDYAHNEMSLKSVLVTMRQYTEKKLICIFGCGGNRSKERRYKMGEVSAEYADVTVITDDNPRYEASMDIISDIETGILRVLDKSDCISFMDELSCGKYIIRSDRQKAIQNTLSKAEKGDMIIIAGKGHENYQEILGIRYPLNDMEIVKEIIRLEKSEYYR